MILSRSNKNGGRTLKRCPLVEENGVLGYKLGYCGHCNESISVRTIDATEILASLRIGEEDAKNLLKKLRPKISWREWIIRKLGGSPVASLAVDIV